MPWPRECPPIHRKMRSRPLLAVGMIVTQFGNYNKTYGSMGAVVILLTWFLLIADVLLVGAEIGAEMERQTRKDTTEV